MGLRMQHDLHTGHGSIAGMQTTKTRKTWFSTCSSEFELCASPEVKSDVQQRCFTETCLHEVKSPRPYYMQST
jgi:hypothetical protein